MEELRNKKAYKIYRKQLNDRSKAFLSEITVNINGLNCPIIWQRLAEWI
jgi:hypothetical protein